MCNRANLFCEGAIQLGSVDLSGKTEILTGEEAEMMQAAVRKTHSDVSTSLARSISSNFSTLHRPWLDKEIVRLESHLAELEASLDSHARATT
jgi:hypothetical protein